jgi:hypothetical protein
MICRVYKNGNFTVRRDNMDDTAETLETLICTINDCIDAPDVADVPNAIEPQTWGNDYFVYYVVFDVNGAPRYYTLTKDDLDTYNGGRTVRFVCDGLAPRFVMPSFFDWYEYKTSKGTCGTLYKLCKPLSDEEHDAIMASGCSIFQTRAQYAPEIRHEAVFVPNGICFSFC